MYYTICVNSFDILTKIKIILHKSWNAKINLPSSNITNFINYITRLSNDNYYKLRFNLKINIIYIRKYIIYVM